MIPKRHWRSYGTEPLPTPAEALDQPFAAFPSWFLRIECDRCGKVRMLNEAHEAASDRRVVRAADAGDDRAVRTMPVPQQRDATVGRQAAE